MLIMPCRGVRSSWDVADMNSLLSLVGDYHPAGKPCIAGIDPGDLEGHVGKLGCDIGDQEEDVACWHMRLQRPFPGC
ncbi:MAG: hypothetical protein ACLR71_05485 [[Clostridium] scindens]